MSQKRSRSINWDEEQKQLFRSILKEYAQVIENKSFNTNTNKIKMKAWEELFFFLLQVPKRHLISSNNIRSGNKTRKDHDDYIESMIKHSRMLKDEEHIRRMEMAEEEHAIKMDIYRQQMKNITLEAEILEIKRRRENL